MIVSRGASFDGEVKPAVSSLFQGLVRGMGRGTETHPRRRLAMNTFVSGKARLAGQGGVRSLLKLRLVARRLLYRYKLESIMKRPRLLATRPLPWVLGTQKTGRDRKAMGRVRRAGKISHVPELIGGGVIVQHYLAKSSGKKEKKPECKSGTKGAESRSRTGGSIRAGF